MPRCPVCDAPVFLHATKTQPATLTAPFCSDRCKTIDLGRWLAESYSVPHVSRPEDEDDLEGLEGEAYPET